MSRYKIWDKVSNVKTNAGEVLAAEEWKTRYPVAREEDSVIILLNNYFDGGIFEELHHFKARCEASGAVFEENLTDKQLLEAIERFEDDYAAEQQTAAAAVAAQEAAYAAASLAAEQDMAAALAYKNMMDY